MYILGRLNDLDKVNDGISFFQKNSNYIIVGMIILIMLSALVFIGFMITDKNKKKVKIEEPKEPEKEHMRSLPCKGDLFIAYYVLSKSNAMDNLSLKGNLISTFYLKWVKKGLLKIKDVEQQNNQTLMYFDETHNDIIDDEIERMLYKVSKDIHELNDVSSFTADEFVKYLSSNNQSIVNFFKAAYEEGQKRFLLILPKGDDGKQFTGRATLPFVQILKKDTYDFENYLKNFAANENPNFQAFKVLDDYYMYANFLGIRESLDNCWFIDKVNKTMQRFVATDITNYINEYAHTDALYSDLELKKNKKVIKKSEKSFGKKSNGKFFK